MPTISKKQQKKMQAARAKWARKRKWARANAKRLRAGQTPEQRRAASDRMKVIFGVPTKTLRMRAAHPNDMTGIPRLRGLGAVTRGGLVTDPRTGQTYRLMPAPPSEATRDTVYATRQPGTVYDADADGWIPREFAPAEYDSDPDYDPTGWHAQAVEATAREIAARPARIAARGQPGVSNRACKIELRAALAFRRKASGFIPQQRRGDPIWNVASRGLFDCSIEAIELGDTAIIAAEEGRCGMSAKLLKQATRFCARTR